jgi:hypothetical protein
VNLGVCRILELVEEDWKDNVLKKYYRSEMLSSDLARKTFLYLDKEVTVLGRKFSPGLLRSCPCQPRFGARENLPTPAFQN